MSPKIGDPWAEGHDAPPPRKYGWGCLAAAIVASAASVIALIVVIKVIVAALAP